MATAEVFIQDVYHIVGIGPIPVGAVKSGVLRVGMQASTNGKVATVKTIEQHHQQIQEAGVGQTIGFTLTGVTKKDVAAGVVMSFSDSGVSAKPSAAPEPIRPKGFLSRLFGR